jgi:hypothetical protein
MATRKPEVLGTVTAPSGALFLIDFGFLELWCHDRKPVMPPGVLSTAEDTADANAGCDFRIDGPDAEKCGRHWNRQWHPRFHFDIPKHAIDTVRKSFAEFVAEHGYDATLTKLRAKVTHRQRIADALEHGKGAGQVFFQGIEGFAFSGVPANTEMLVTGERMGGRDRAHKERWRWVNLEVRPGAKVASEVEVGRVFVDRARLMFADIDALRDWNHDGSTDGKADAVFWGRDAEAAAKATKAPKLPAGDSDQYGWENLPEVEALEKARAVWKLKEPNGWLFALDFRPHSHHWEVLRQVRATATESGTIAVGGASLCGFMTSWGDGLYPVFAERTKAGELVRVRIRLGDDARVQMLNEVLTRAQVG